MRWYEPTFEKLENGKIYSHGELVELLKADYPYVSHNSYNWAMSELVKCGKLAKVGYNQYSILTGESKLAYTPHYSKLAEDIISSTSSQYPDTEFVVIETDLINEFLNNPIGKNLVIVQVNKKSDEEIFRFLQHQGVAGLLYRPTKRYFDFYRVGNSIVIGNLVSESPVCHNRPHGVCMEKLLVDMFCDRYITWIYDVSEFPDAIRVYFARSACHSSRKPL